MTHAYLGLAAFDLTASALGYALLFGLGFVRRRVDALRYLGLAFLAGWATLSTAIATGFSLGVDPVIRNVLLLAAGSAAVCLGARRVFPALERPARPADRDPLLRAAAIGGACLLGVAIVGSFLYSVRAGADYFWDTWAFWIPKAKAIYYFHGATNVLGGFTTWTNSEYPPLVPATTAATFHFMGGVHAALLPLQQSLLSIAFLTSVVVVLAPRVPRWILFPLLAMLALAPGFWSRMGSVAPDQTTAYLLAGAVLACIFWIDERRLAWLPLATIFLAAATLTKEEGFSLSMLLALVVLGAAVVVHRWRAYPALVLFLGPASIRPWHDWLTDHGMRVAPTEYDWHDLLKPDVLADRGDRLGFAAHKLTDFMFTAGAWSLVVPLTLAVVALAFAAGAARVLASAVTVWLLGAFCGLAAVYWIGRPEVHWYVNTSGDRVIGTIPIVAGSVLPLLLALVLERRARPAEEPLLDDERALHPLRGVVLHTADVDV